GRYLEPKELEAAFQLKQPLPEPLGIYLNQPNPSGNKGGWLAEMTVALVALLAFIQFVSVSRARNQTVADHDFTYIHGDTNQPTPTLEFEVQGQSQAVKITSSASLANSWLELGYELRNVKTGEARQFLEALEYYSGTDWSEGSWQKSAV